MNKNFYFQISNGEEEWESKEYPTKEEAEQAMAEAKDEGYITSDLSEVRE